MHLRNAGYFVEVLGAPFTCFDASQYSKSVFSPRYLSWCVPNSVEVDLPFEYLLIVTTVL